MSLMMKKKEREKEGKEFSSNLIKEKNPSQLINNNFIQEIKKKN